MNICELTLVVLISPQVKNRYTRMRREGCRDEFVSGLGRRLLVNYGCWIVVCI
jgi:hypothetical protein